LILRHQKLAEAWVKLNLANRRQSLVVQLYALERSAFTHLPQIPKLELMVVTRGKHLLFSWVPSQVVCFQVKVEFVCHVILPHVEETDKVISRCGGDNFVLVVLPSN
jgi:hypothetical protein